MLPTTRLEEEYRPNVEWYAHGDHTVIEGAFTDVDPKKLGGTVNLFVFDTPSVDSMESDVNYAAWLGRQFAAMEKWRARDAGLIIVPTDRKGHPWSKSVVTAYVAQAYGWQLFRHFIWERQEADFHRAQYAFQDVWAFRKGNMATNANSTVRYKDVVKFVQPHDTESHVGELSVEMLTHFMTLYAKPWHIVMDPFAGRGTVMHAAHRLSLRSVSVELHPDRANELRDLAVSLKGAI